MSTLNLTGPDLFEQIADGTPGFYQPYPIVDRAVAAEVLQALDSKLAWQVVQTGEIPLTYVDGAASSKAIGPALEVLHHSLGHHANTHSEHHNPARITGANYRRAHETLLRISGADPETHTTIFHGQGTTDVINLAARLVFERPYNRASLWNITLERLHNWFYQRTGIIVGTETGFERDTAIINGMEHHANLLPWAKHAPRTIKVPFENRETGALNYDGLFRAIEDVGHRLAIVPVSITSNVTGIVNNTATLAERVHTVGGLVFGDCAHAFVHAWMADVFGFGPINMTTLGLDAIALSGHKAYAPLAPGAGVFPKKWAKLHPIPVRTGGGIVLDVSLEGATYTDCFPARFDAGTPPIHGAIMLASNLEFLEAIGMQRIWEHELALTTELIAGLQKIPDIIIYGDTNLAATPRAGNISINMTGVSQAILSAALSDYFNIATRDGCFCAQVYVKGLLALHPEEEIQLTQELRQGKRKNIPGMVRFGLGICNSSFQIQFIIKALTWIQANKSRLLAEYEVHDDGVAVRRDGWTVNPKNYLATRSTRGKAKEETTTARGQTQRAETPRAQAPQAGASKVNGVSVVGTMRFTQSLEPSPLPPIKPNGPSSFYIADGATVKWVQPEPKKKIVTSFHTPRARHELSSSSHHSLPRPPSAFTRSARTGRAFYH